MRLNAGQLAGGTLTRRQAKKGLQKIVTQKRGGTAPIEQFRHPFRVEAVGKARSASSGRRVLATPGREHTNSFHNAKGEFNGHNFNRLGNKTRRALPQVKGKHVAMAAGVAVAVGGGAYFYRRHKSGKRVRVKNGRRKRK